MSRIPLIYALHSGNLYGTERMALATAAELSDQFEPIILAPEGPVSFEADRMGLKFRSFASPLQFAREIRPMFRECKKIAFIATGLTHSLAAIALNSVYRRRISHLHVVHGGTDERLSYGRKRLLNHTSAGFIAVSHFVKQRLIAHGVRPEKVTVIENFLTRARTDDCPKRAPFETAVRRAVVISRIDAIKRVDLLLDALDRESALGNLQIRVLGTGWELESLRDRARRTHPNVDFAGFVDDIEGELAVSDLLIHLCPVEPFGLAIVEAMAANLPVIVPDQGGAASLIQDHQTGFHFRSNDAGSLAARLVEILQSSPETLNRVVMQARQLLYSRFSWQARIQDYRSLLEAGLA